MTLLNTSPDGRNINAGCGALHPEYVASEVKARGAAIGLTFDGDADRCMLAGAKGNVVNGDAILLMAARDLKARGMLTGDVVVATTMSNMGLEAALKRSGIRMERAPVGDRYVLEEMQKTECGPGRRAVRTHSLSSPGHDRRRPAHRARRARPPRPHRQIDRRTHCRSQGLSQVIVNVKVREKKPLETIPPLSQAIRAAEAS